jgi:hypothetical protein
MNPTRSGSHGESRVKEKVLTELTPLRGVSLATPDDAGREERSEAGRNNPSGLAAFKQL